MKKSVLISCLLLLALCTSAYAIPMKTAEHGTVPMRDRAAAQDGCLLSYYNFCSGWVFYWTAYCYGNFTDLTLPPRYGTVFDLSDCPGNCRHLTDIWWACKRFANRGYVDVEVYCANENRCPIGPPILGWYGYTPPMTNPWQHFVVDPVPLCVCEESGSGKFAVIVTDFGFGTINAPYSDIESMNIDVGCQADWNCVGHSYCFRCLVNYCDVYGMPGPMWVSGADYGCTNVPTVPPGCHDYQGYGTGMFTEFLIDVYIACQGPTAAENDSWTDIKGLYR